MNLPPFITIITIIQPLADLDDVHVEKYNIIKILYLENQHIYNKWLYINILNIYTYDYSKL